MSRFEIICINCKTLLENPEGSNPPLKYGYYCRNCDYFLDIEVILDCKKEVIPLNVGKIEHR